MTPLEELLRATLHDPARELSAAPDSVEAVLRRTGRLRRRRLAGTAAVAACVLAVAAGAAATRLGDGQRAAPAGGHAPSQTATGEVRDADVVRRISTPLDGVAALAMDAQALYVLGGPTGSAHQSAVLRVNRASGQVVGQKMLANEPAALALGPAGSLWMTTRGERQASYALLQLDRRTLEIRRTLHLDDPPVALAVAGSTLWAGSRATLYQLDAGDGRVVRRLRLNRPIFALAVNASQHLLYASVADELRGAVIALDADTGKELGRRSLSGPPAPVGQELWALSGNDAQAADIRRLDPRTLVDRESGEIGRQHDRGTAVWPGGDVLWVTNVRKATLSCVDPAAGEVLGVRRLEPGTLVADEEALYAITGTGLVQVAPASICRG